MVVPLDGRPTGDTAAPHGTHTHTTGAPGVLADTRIVSAMFHNPSVVAEAPSTHAGEPSGTTGLSVPTPSTVPPARHPATTNTDNSDLPRTTGAPHTLTEHTQTPADDMVDVPANTSTIGPEAAAHRPSVSAQPAGTTSIPAKSPGLLSTSAFGGLLNCAPQTGCANSSSGLPLLGSIHMDDFLAASSHMASAHRQVQQTNFVSDPSSLQHLAHSPPPPAAAAPAAPIAFAPISPTPLPTTAVEPAASAPRSAHNAQHAHAHSSESVEQKEQQHAPSSTGPSGPSAHPTLQSRLASMMSAAFRTPTHTPAAPQAQQQTHAHAPLDTACHCLVVDETRLAQDSVDQAQFKLALGLASDRPALQAHTRAWLKDNVHEGDVCVVYVPTNESRKLHINFTSLTALGRGLTSCPFLVRCGTIGSSQWNTRPCGLARHKLPEMLQFSCAPSRPKPRADLHADVVALFASVGLEYTSIWYPSQYGADARTHNERIAFSVLPRHTASLEQTISDLH